MPGQEKDSLSRRAFVGRVATVTAGAAVALTATTASRSSAATRASGIAANAPRSTAPRGEDQHARPEAPQVVEPQAAAKAPQSEAAPAPWEVLAPLTVGATLNADWKLSGLTPIQDGSSVLTLANQRGREQRVHLCRNDGKPQGLVYTDRFDLVVMNGGRGDLPTEEDFGRAVAAVAHAIAANESGSRHAPTLAKLLPQTERIERFATTARLR